MLEFLSTVFSFFKKKISVFLFFPQMEKKKNKKPPSF